METRFRKPGWGLALLLTAITPQLLAADSDAGTAPDYDTRVLIDVSGSMQHNDPQNLRIPALKLLINLLPPSSRGGVWLFAEAAIPLIPVGDFASSQKRSALEAADKIHSRGRFTDIEAALKAAIADWEKPAPHTRRSLIVLTDGMVDLAEGADASARSRARILSELIPILQRQGIQAHTVTLSDQADRELLQRIAFDSGGWSESASDAARLQRSFLKLFAKASPRDSVPLRGNRFQIDASISEFSLLVFHPNGADPVQLLGPDAVPLSLASTREDLHWFHEQNYDLVTVTKPATGEWQLIADTDPDNQVYIVTDLSLNLGELPNYVMEKERLQFAAFLREQGQLIRRTDFLQLLEAELEQTDNLGRKLSWQLRADPEAPATFSQAIKESLGTGTHTLTLTVNGHTFQRTASHTLEVRANPIEVSVQGETSESDAPQILIELRPDADLIDTTTLVVEAIVIDSQRDSQTVPLTETDGSWRLRLDKPPADQRLVINFNARAQTLRGQPIEPELRPVVLDDKTLAALFPPTRAVMEAIAEEDSPMMPAENNEADSEALSGWAMTALVAIAINLAAGGAGYWGYRYYRRRSAQKQADLVARLKT